MTSDQFVDALPVMYSQLRYKAYHACRNSDEAEDLRAETLRRAWAKREQIRYPKAWAQLACGYIHLAQFRRAKMDPLDAMDIDVPAAVEPSTLEDDDILKLRQKIRGLAPLHKQAIRRWLKGQSCQGTWGSRLHVAKMTLRKAWHYNAPQGGHK